MSAKKGNQNAKGKHWKLSEETKRKQGLASKARWQNEEFRTKTIATLKEVKNTPEAKLKSSITSKEIHSRPEVKEKHKNNVKEAINTPEELTRRKNHMFNLWKDEDYKNKMIENITKLWKDSEYISKTLDGMKKYHEKHIVMIPKTIEEIIQELGEPPVCDCDECKKVGRRVEIKISSYKKYKKKGYPKYTIGHGTLGKKFPKHSIRMSGKNNPMFGVHRKDLQIKLSGSGNPMYGNPREDLQVKFKGSGNPMFGKIPSSKCGNGMQLYYKTPLQGIKRLRSSYEYKYAQYLDQHNILWYYEIDTFPVSDNMNYTPDFYLVMYGKFIDTKEYMKPLAKLKIEKFKDEYPWDLDVLFKEDLEKLGIKLKLTEEEKTLSEKLKLEFRSNDGITNNKLLSEVT